MKAERTNKPFVVRVAGPVAGLILATLVGFLVPSSCQKPRPPKPLLGGEVHGFVVAELKVQREVSFVPPPRGLYLPDISVFLKNLATGNVGPKVNTNPHGWYMLPRHAAGRYQLCLEGTGFVPRCDPTSISLSSETYSTPRDASIEPLPGVVQGRVLLKDGAVCYHENPFFGTLQTTKVSLEDGGGTVVAGPVLANSMGHYVLPKIPAPGTYVIKGSCAGATAKRPVTLSALDLTGANAFNLTLDNAAPQIVSIIPTLGGKAVQTAAPGDMLQVKVTAVSPVGNQLHYRWGDGTPGFVSADSPTITWNLPNVQGTNVLFVEVTDNKGGFADSRLSLTTSNAGAVFAGTVSETPGLPPVAGASVGVNGKLVTTDATGHFLIRVAESDRYVLNVKKPTYALLSQVFHAGTTGLDLRLSRARRQACDPKTLCSAIEETHQTVSGVAIEANTLVDTKGNPVTTPFNVDVHGYDLQQPNPIPGDFSAKDKSGQDVRMETYGAVHVEVTDGGGSPLKLGPGAEAEIFLQVDPARLATAPPTIPLLSYDEVTGYWKQEGEARLVGSRYEGRIRHFSQFNADTVFVDTACIKMTVDDTPTTTPPRFAPPFPFRLHVSIPTSAGPVRHNDFPVTEKINGLFRLPPNTIVTLEIHPASGPDAVIRSFTVNSGAAISNSFNGFPPLPYDACQGFDPSSTLPGQPVFLAVDLPTHNIPYLSIAGAGSQAEAAAYYNANAGVTTDALNTTCTGQKCTLAGWKTANLFDGTEPAVAYFYNAGDLGLGREMHCRKNGSDVACYVTNYGHNFPPAADPDSAIADAISHTNPIATVAMEYSAAGGSTGVKFYVFFHATGDKLANQAVLDSEGPKNVPHLCIQCHGGYYDATSHTANGASFLPFDVFSFAFNAAAGVTLAGQQEQFRQLNSLVAATNPNSVNSNNPILNLINGWYPCGVNNVGCNPVNTYSPPPPNPGWAIKPDLYQKIPRVYCRTCHVAQNSGIDWTQYTQFANDFSGTPPGFRTAIQSRVCTASAHSMPHAEVPFKKFWFSTDPHAPFYLADPGTGLGFPGGAANGCPP